MTKKILVVDDEPDVLKTISFRLKAEKYEVITASNGKEALQAANKKNPDLILMDIRMPEMDGFEATQILKKDKKTNLIPIIIVTASKDDTESIVKGFECGADDYITAPYNKFELLARVKAALRLRALWEELVKYQRLTAITETVVTLSHEINNPLNIIIGSTEFLTERKSISEKDIEKTITFIKEASSRIAAIMNKLSNLKEEVETDYLPGMKMIDVKRSKEK